jgi:hypothetical protein
MRLVEVNARKLREVAFRSRKCLKVQLFCQKLGGWTYYF